MAASQQDQGQLLSAEQQQQLDEFKAWNNVLNITIPWMSAQVKTRIENERYLRSHPEIAVMISEFSKSGSCYCHEWKSVIVCEQEGVRWAACKYRGIRSRYVDDTLVL